MLEIYRMQLWQILAGRMKWLVTVILLLPVLLTLTFVGAGGLAEINREVDQAIARERLPHDLAAGKLPSSARPLSWEGKDVSLGRGELVLTEQGIRQNERIVGTVPRAVRPMVMPPVSRGDTDVIVRDGEIVIPESEFLNLERLAADNATVVVNDGYLIYAEGQLWIDDSKEPRWRNLSSRSYSQRQLDQLPPPEVPVTMRTITAFYLFLLYPQVICLLISLFYGTSVLGHELSGKTLTYLFTRSLPRWKFVVGKYFGILAALVIPAALSLGISWMIMGAEGGFGLFLGLLVATVGALMGYNALFILFGFLIPRRAMIAALLYGVVFELILSFVPALVNKFTITYYLRSFVVKVLDVKVPDEAVRVIGGASPLGAVLTLTAMTVGALALSSVLALHREYVIHDQA